MDMTPAHKERLEQYESRSALPMLVLALVFLVVYAIPVIWRHVPEGLTAVLTVLTVVIWTLFVVDLVARAVLSGRPWQYVLRHPIDVLLILLPMLRPLRVLRVFTAAQYFVTRGQRVAVGRTLAAALGAVLFIGVVAALAVLDSEHGAPGARITSFGTALWWVAETVTTVGYGDVYPVTAEGRFVAVGLMLVGISMLGVVTASVAAWFVRRTRTAEDEVLAEIRSLRDEVAQLRRQLDTG